MRDQLTLAPHEASEDAVAVVAELAMKRAASFGRAPVLPDVEIAASLLGYLGDVDPDVRRVAGRTAVHGADHEYGVRRAIVDAVPDEVLRMPPQVPALVAEARARARRRPSIG